MNKNTGYTIFFDFDNTITSFDVIDDMLARFSRDKKWMSLEKKWKKGLIGSKECLAGQIKGLNITKKGLDRYLSRVPLDPYFKTLKELLDSKDIKIVILTDDFDYIVRGILKAHGMDGINIRSNRLKVSGDNLVPSFPLGNDKCAKCAHCKKSSMRTPPGKRHLSVYIGDGLSDLCPAKECDIIFAKEPLIGYLNKDKVDHIPFKKLKKVYNYFKGHL